MVTISPNNPFNTPERPATRVPGGISFSPSNFSGMKTEIGAAGKTRLIWLSVILGVLVVGFLLWYLGFLTPVPATLPQSTQFNPDEIRISNLKRLPLDDIVASPIFKSLKLHGVLPVVPDNLGRPNPFLPF